MALYHVIGEFRPGVDMAKFQAAMNPADSWYRVSNNSWILCSPGEGAKAWQERLSPYTQPDGCLFVSRFDTEEYYGVMPTDFWAWLNTHKEHRP
jgi:hypothetical protein